MDNIRDSVLSAASRHDSQLTPTVGKLELLVDCADGDYGINNSTSKNLVRFIRIVVES